MRIMIAFSTLFVSMLQLCFGLLIALHRQQPVRVDTKTVLGKSRQPISIKVFKVKNRPLANVDLWLHYLKGDFDLVGPKALNKREAKKLARNELKRFDVAPGLITPYEVKMRSGIAHVSERRSAVDFVKNASALRRLQILIAAIFQRVIGNNVDEMPESKSINLLNVRLDNVTMLEAVNAIMHRVSNRHASNRVRQFSFVNADCVNKYVNDAGYRHILNSCERVFADGIGVRIAARWHQTPLKDNVNGTDMFPLLCERLAHEGKRVFLYGGKQRVADKVAAKLKREFPTLKVVGVLDGYSHAKQPNLVNQKINDSQADLVFVALGAPLQERWIADNQQNLNVNAAVGVGGLFDFYSESVSRAPEWVRELSMEWVWRLCAQPKDKAKRYLVGNPLFLLRVISARVFEKSNSRILEVS